MSAGNGTADLTATHLFLLQLRRRSVCNSLNQMRGAATRTKGKASDVGSKDDEIVTQEVIRSTMGEAGARKREREKNKTTATKHRLFYQNSRGETFPAADAAAEPPIFLNCCGWSRDACWRRCCWICTFVRDGLSGGNTHRIPARHILQQLAAHPVAASHLISRLNKGSRRR